MKGRDPMASKKQEKAKIDSATAEQFLVRIKKHEPRKGFVMMRFTAFGVLFEESKGWYVVDAKVAQYLKTIRQRPQDPDCPQMAFDVCTQAEADAINAEETERAIRQGKASPNAAHKVRGRDVRTGTDLGPKKENMPPPGYDLTTDDLRPPPRDVPARSTRAARDRE
jgi:hypothetical protein